VKERRVERSGRRKEEKGGEGQGGRECVEEGR
jgi:hypothetical protein